MDLPSLQELSESEIGPLIAGDWLCNIGPYMRDLSASSAGWWDLALRTAGEAYDAWINADPMTKLRIQAVNPVSFAQSPWSRVEQRGSVALLKALPESIKQEVITSRDVGSVPILFRILKTYQPGGLAERSTLLRQLVEQKVPSAIGDWLQALRSWRRWLTRLAELRVPPPDPVLLMGTMEKYAAVLSKADTQSAFRLQVARAGLRVDVAPSMEGVHEFAQVLLAEGEAMFHGGGHLPVTTKVKAMDATNKSQDQKDGKGGKSEGKGASKSDGKGSGDQTKTNRPCHFFTKDGGCKRGASCSFVHEWGSVNKRGRCWNCGSASHLSPDCTAPKASAEKDPKVKKQYDKSREKPTGKKAVVEEVARETVVEKGEKPAAPTTSSAASSNAAEPGGSGVATEVVQLIRSMKTSVKSTRLVAVNSGSSERALLDGGATHILRQARSTEEYQMAVPTRVELAAGEVTLRQVESTGTLLTDFPTQVIVPLGKLALSGFKVHWEGDEFRLFDPNGVKLDVVLEGHCPTVSLEVAEELIEWLEKRETDYQKRMRALRAGEPGDVEPQVWEWLRKFQERFPEVPDEIVVRVIPSGRWKGSDVPWNRHLRRRWSQADSIVVHLFSGPDQKWWKSHLEGGGRSVVCVDRDADPAQDLLADGVASFLAEMCMSGVVDALLGGPPCRTVSRARFRQPGPPPLRARYGPERFGLSGLTHDQRELAIGDGVLWLRQLWLYTLAQDARPKKVGFLKEHPRDPEEYKKEGDNNQYPSYFAWPEWKSFCEEFGIEELRLDFGALGHSRRKPTTLGTNLRLLRDLDGLRGDGLGDKAWEDLDGQERYKASRTWAAWPLKFKERVLEALRAEFKCPMVMKLSQEQWEQRKANDHQPFSRECAECQRGAGKSRRHRRVPHPDTYTLSVDLCGPFHPGVDQECTKAKYFLTGVFTIPIVKKGKEVNCLAPGIEDVLVKEKKPDAEIPDDEPLAPEVLAEDAPREEGEDLSQDREWEELVEVREDEEIEVRNYTMVEVLPNKKTDEVTAAIARMVARLKYLGLEPRRVHSDRAREMSNRVAMRWFTDRGIIRTFTSGADFKANGRAEAEIGMIRRGINVIMKASKDSEKHWPLMARHIGERRGRMQLAALGFETPKMLPYGTQVMVKTKSWDDFQGHWRARKKKGIVRGPDVSMSMTAGGYFVEVEDGKFLRADDVVVSEEGFFLEGEIGLEAREAGPGPLPALGEPRRRITGKTSMMAVSVNEAESRLHRGCELANEEFRKIEKGLETADVSLIAKMDKENRFLENEINEIRLKQVQVEETGGVAQEQFLQTRTFGLQEVRRELHRWIKPMSEERSSLLENAIREVSSSEADRLMEEARALGMNTEKIPAKGVFTQKAGSGRLRARIVACGNLMSERSAEELYAGGVDSTQVRVLLRRAAVQKLQCLTLDIRTAFLLAPTSQKELIVLQPPRILVEAGVIDSDTMWIVTGAVYGLTAAPRDWAIFRDQRLKSFRWQLAVEKETLEMSFEPLGDANLWKIVGRPLGDRESSDGGDQGDHSLGDEKKSHGEPRVLGHMAVYVDDIMMIGSDAVVWNAAEEIQRNWKTSAPEVAGPRSAMRFLGMEIDREENGEFKIHQTSYTMELLERHQIETKTLAIRVPEEPQSEEVTADAVKRAQGLTGELQWLAGKTRPDITCAVTKMAQNTTKKPEWACRLGEAILHYLNGTVDAGLVYGEVIAESDDPEMLRRCPRTSGTIEVMTDASFAAGDGHSVTGLVILYGGAPIQWETKKQGLIALSTAEAELTSLLEGLQCGRAARSLINLIEESTVMELLNDNRAALILASNQGGGWRTRHLRIRANCLAEAVDTKEVDLQHRVGTKLWADSLTKVLAAPSLQRFKDGIGLRSSSDEVLVGGPKVKVSRVLGLNEDIKDRLLKALLILLLAGATMDDVKAATGKEMDLNSSEVPKGAELSGELP